MAQDYAADVKIYAKAMNEEAVAGIVRYLGIALKSADASLVSCSDKTELDRVREKFCKKKLARTEDDAALDDAIKSVCEKMKADRTKSRVTFYYLLAEHYGQLDMFVKKPKA
jgi:hypothetical protein